MEDTLTVNNDTEDFTERITEPGAGAEEMPEQADEATEKTEETVDDILNMIISKDGSFSSDFTELFKKYSNGKKPDITPAARVDISDRSKEVINRAKVEYEDPDLVVRKPVVIPKHFADQLTAKMRYMYIENEDSVKRPQFTSDGMVKYPSLGTGISEERVVFDADWEKRAREEAAERENIRRENMLRGDSAYARMFVTGSGMENEPPKHYVPARENFIDPLTDDEIEYFEDRTSESAVKNRQSLEEVFGTVDENDSEKGVFRRKSRKI